MCTSTVGMATAFSASSSATLVWVYAAGLRMMPSTPSKYACWMASTSAPS